MGGDAAIGAAAGGVFTAAFGRATCTFVANAASFGLAVLAAVSMIRRPMQLARAEHDGPLR
ncbi:MAG: hypothetical protein R2715_19485 [Ilumatobacteraceae bacterium]